LKADHNARTNVGILEWFGLKINLEVIKYTLLALLLNSVLFMGEIFQVFKGMVTIRYCFDILALKNLIVAPLFEEFIYRVCLINMFMESGALTEFQAVLVLPMFFAISHVHHVFRLRKEEQISKRKALMMCAFQVMYTQIFGLYSGLVYVRTGSIWPAFALHSQCNYFGFPSFSSFFNRNFKLTDRITTGVLYAFGVFLFFFYFNQTFSGHTPWWS